MGTAACQECGGQTDEAIQPCRLCQADEGLFQRSQEQPQFIVTHARHNFRPFSKWIHKKGDIYQIICVTNLNCTEPGWEPTVVYQRLQDGKLFSRPLNEWTPERYKRVA